MNKPPVTLKTPGIQARIARKIGTSRQTVNAVFCGRQIASRKIAAKLEDEFVRLGIPLTRWDIMYGVKPGQSLAAYLDQKGA